MKLMLRLSLLAFVLIIMPAAAHLALAAEPRELAEADALLQAPRLDAGQARAARARYEALLVTPGIPRTALLARLARVGFLLGELVPEDQRQANYQKGLSYAELLLQEQPGAVEGHYWAALNLCGLAEVGGKLTGFKLLPRIIQELQRSLTLAESYDHAGAHRVLGRIYYEAPGRPISVGDIQKSLQHLSAAVRLAPETSTNHLYLAETLIKLGETAQARQELQQVLSSTRAAVLPQNLEEDRREARRLLQDLAEK